MRVSVVNLSSTFDVLLLYPGDSLKDQISSWSLRHPERRAVATFAQSPPEVRTLLRRAGAAMVDATYKPAQASSAFLQAVDRLGPDAVTMYSETMHEGLELFARTRGSLFFFGPLAEEQWDDLFDRLLSTRRRLAIQSLGPHRPLPAHWLDRSNRRRSRFINRFCASLDWPITDVN
jgi:hypothetical protein